MRSYEPSAVEIAEDIRRGRTSAVDYLTALFDRIDEVEVKVHSFVTLTKDLALQQAKTVNAKVKANEKLGRLAGLPIAIKDNMCTNGIRTTCSSRMLENFVPPYSATVVERILAEDGIILGKTNMDEFAMGSSTETSFFGVTRNPWDLSRVPGGSSGGSASSVASYQAPLALGSDTGGSIRCPASFCGIVGLKPTYGLVSRYGLIPYGNSLEQIGPMARSVKDCALLLNVIADHDPHDSTSAPHTPHDYLSFAVDDVHKLRFGVIREALAEGIDEKVGKCVWKTVEALENLGASYSEVSLPSLNYALPAYYIIATAEASSNLARYDGLRYGFTVDYTSDFNEAYSKTRALGFGPEVRRRIMLGTYALSAGYYDRFFLKAVKVANLVKMEFMKTFKDYDFLLGPTMPFTAFKIGEKIMNPLALYLSDVDTVPPNLAGLPAMSINCGLAEGLPVGVQFIAPHFREDILIRVAYTLEQHSTQHRPPP